MENPVCARVGRDLSCSKRKNLHEVGASDSPTIRWNSKAVEQDQKSTSANVSECEFIKEESAWHDSYTFLNVWFGMLEQDLQMFVESCDSPHGAYTCCDLCRDCFVFCTRNSNRICDSLSGDRARDTRTCWRVHSTSAFDRARGAFTCDWLYLTLFSSIRCFYIQILRTCNFLFLLWNTLRRKSLILFLVVLSACTLVWRTCKFLFSIGSSLPQKPLFLFFPWTCQPFHFTSNSIRNSQFLAEQFVRSVKEILQESLPEVIWGSSLFRGAHTSRESRWKRHLAEQLPVIEHVTPALDAFHAPSAPVVEYLAPVLECGSSSSSIAMQRPPEPTTWRDAHEHDQHAPLI